MNMMKKIVSVLMVAVLLFTVAPMTEIKVSALDATGQCGDNVYWTFDETTGTLTISGTGDMWDYSYEFRTPFSGSEIKAITVESGVTGIGNDAFQGCINLESIIIPDSITFIGMFAFYACKNLTNVHFCGTETQWDKIEIRYYPYEIIDGIYNLVDVADKVHMVTDENNDGMCDMCYTEIAEKETTTSTTAVPTTKTPTAAPTTEQEQPTVKAQKPAKPKIKKPKSTKKKQVVVTWNAVKDVNGYQVVYSTSKKFTKKLTKIKFIKKAKTTKTTLKKLQSGKKYFIRVRAYKTVNGKKIYGTYSKVMSVKVK